MKIETASELSAFALDLRNRLETAFSEETRNPGAPNNPPSTGHCLAVAVLVQRLLPENEVTLMVTSAFGGNHYFNRVVTSEGVFDVDLTGDQFGLSPVQVSDELYMFSFPGDVTMQFPMPRARSQFLARVDILENRVNFQSAQ